MKTVVKYFIPVVLFVFIAGCVEQNDGTAGQNQETTEQKEWAIVIHGGAGAISKDKPDSVIQAYKEDLRQALSIGVEILENGGEAVDAVEQVIRYFENNPRFNAGKGAVYTHYGGHELDAAIMIGNTRSAGAVTGVKTVKHPITLARKVMEESKHVFFAGQGAEEFATEVGVERVNNEYFNTEGRYESWKRAIESDAEEESTSSLINNDTWSGSLGTVGCVVLDSDGTLVAGTSTGGMTNKMFGRVGDVPIIGSGTYASEIVAVSMTGWGERIMENVSGHTVSAYMRFNEEATLEEAGDYLLQEVLEPGWAGMIAVDRHGHTYMETNTQGMYRGMADSEGNFKVGIWD